MNAKIVAGKFCGITARVVRVIRYPERKYDKILLFHKSFCSIVGLGMLWFKVNEIQFLKEKKVGHFDVAGFFHGEAE